MYTSYSKCYHTDYNISHSSSVIAKLTLQCVYTCVYFIRNNIHVFYVIYVLCVYIYIYIYIYIHIYICMNTPISPNPTH